MIEEFWKVIAIVLIALIFSLHLEKTEKIFCVLLSIAVCCLGGTVIGNAIHSIMDFLHELEALGQIRDGFLQILLKCVGIALITELAGLICRDSGNGSLERMLHLLGSMTIVYLSLPMVSALLTLIREILGDL